MPGASSSADGWLPDWDTTERFWPIAAPLVLAPTRLYASLRTDGLEHIPRSGPALLAANHVSGVDPLIVVRAALRAGRRARFLAAEFLFTHPLAGAVVRRARMVPVHRGGGFEHV